MMTIDFWTDAISKFGTFLTSIFLFCKAGNLRPSTIIMMLSAFWCLAWAILDAFNIPWMPFILVRSAFCAATIFFLWILFKEKLDTAVSAFLLSYGISYVFHSIAFLIIGFTFAPFLSTGLSSYSLINFNQPIYLLLYTLIAVLQILIAFLFFKIRRFKLGFPFLSGRYTVATALIITGIVLALASLVAAQEGNFGTYRIFVPLAAGIIIVGVGIYIWIKRSMKIFQRKRAWEHNEELYLQEKEELNSKLEYYKEMHETVMAANHRMMHRQAMTERSVLKLMEKMRDFDITAEFSEELGVMMNEIRNLSGEYVEEVGEKVFKKLPSTNIKTVDDMFAFFAERFADNGIDFSLKINGSIIYMVENVITRGKLETMIGDHLQDALVAVKASDGDTRSVLAMLGEVEDCYEFSVQDSGIPFEPDTLVRLGKERVTTKEDGVGIGFMTTFATMRECGASLVIHENTPASDFSKTITIRFDRKQQYVIETYRPNDFPESDRYVIIDHKREMAEAAQ